MSSGTRYNELYINGLTSMSTNGVFMIPYYNLMNISQGNLFNQRTGSSIFLHRIEIQVSVRPDPITTSFPNGATSSTNMITDFRVRLIAAN